MNQAFPREPLSALLAGAASVFIMLLLSGCSGEAEEAPFFDVEKSPTIAGDSLPELEDMPGLGWEVALRDFFRERNADTTFLTFLNSNPACAATKAAQQEEILRQLVDEVPGAAIPRRRAMIGFGRNGTLGNYQTNARYMIHVWESKDDAEFPALTKAVLGRPDHVACVEAYAQQVIQSRQAQTPGSQGNATVTVVTSVPQGGVGMVLELTLTGPSGTATTAYHRYSWAYGNATADVVLQSIDGSLTPALISDILKAFDEELRATEKAQ